MALFMFCHAAQFYDGATSTSTFTVIGYENTVFLDLYVTVSSAGGKN
jgi:hypothetical protein